MSKKQLEEDISNVKFLIRDLKADNYTTTFINSIENILADRERLETENQIYKEEHQKITKALDFKEGKLNPNADITIKAIKKALIQATAKANKYDSLIEKIKNNLRKKKLIKECEAISDREHLDGEIFALQELLDTEKE